VPAIIFAKREIRCKLVYYGPGLSGKTTNLKVIHRKAPKGRKGDLTEIATEGDRTLFFDYMPLELGTIGGFKTKFQLYTVPGQQYYNATRKLVLRGVDGVIFVADSQAEALEENLESFRTLEENLREEGIDPTDLPLVIQWNKRDMPTALPVEELDRAINKFGSPTFEAQALSGEGVFATLRRLAELVLHKLNREFRSSPPPPKAEERVQAELERRTEERRRREEEKAEEVRLAMEAKERERRERRERIRREIEQREAERVGVLESADVVGPRLPRRGGSLRLLLLLVLLGAAGALAWQHGSPLRLWVVELLQR
jgi:signal recognition particle receptor subunit beta